MNDPKLHPAVLDVGDKKAIKEFWGLSREKLGQRAPDLLVNNVGITRDCSFGKMGHDHWEEMMRVNLSSIFHMSQSHFLWAREDKAGCKSTPRAIVNLSSLSAKIGTFGQANYCAAKAGVYGITKNNAREMAPYNFRVNAVSPGTILTPMVMVMPEHIREATIQAMIPMARGGEPEEVAKSILFLGSDMSSYVTGVNFGGRWWTLHV